MIPSISVATCAPPCSLSDSSKTWLSVRVPTASRISTVVIFNRPSYLQYSFRTAEVWLNLDSADGWGYSCGTIQLDEARSPQRYEVDCGAAVGSYVTVRMVQHNLPSSELSGPYLVLGEIVPYLCCGGLSEQAEQGVGTPDVVSTPLALELSSGTQPGPTTPLLVGVGVGLGLVLILLLFAWRLASFFGLCGRAKTASVAITDADTAALGDPAAGSISAKLGAAGRLPSESQQETALAQLIYGTTLDLTSLKSAAQSRSQSLVDSADKGAREKALLWLSAAEAMAAAREAEAADMPAASQARRP